MKCIVCDRCKTIIEDVRRCKVITCARPLKPDVMDKPPYRGNDPKVNDILWTKELCNSCVDELEAFFTLTTASGESFGSTDAPSDGATEEDGTQDIE